MAISDSARKAVLNELKKREPLMDIESVRQELLDWLEQIPFPDYPDASNWRDCIKTFPADENDQDSDSGLRVRLALRLFTAHNRYVVSLMESLDPGSRGVYILTAHVNWKEDERKRQMMVDRGYIGHFDDVLKARHTIWAQTVRRGEIHEGLNACAAAILGNELTGTCRNEIEGTRVTIGPVQPVKLPEPE
ncbi:MAG: hypothetical protein JW763_06880 [candidate division Zixibacteria bacterium]|nr:hypothetical protein [candidate division Zixibacteria bacterium]